MKTIKFAFIALVALTPLTGCANINRNATVKVRVVDEDGQPIKGVHSKVMSYSMDDSNSRQGLTDANGIYSVHLRNIHLSIGGYFSKPGYYETKGEFWGWGLGQGLVPPADTNFVIVLKRIIDPVAMIRKEVLVKIPRVDEPIGFDLEMGDWVSPDGKGKIADILFTQEGYYTSNKDYSFTLLGEFVAGENGIQSFQVPRGGAGALLRSELPPPSIAPELGHEKTFESFNRRDPSVKFGPSAVDVTRRWIYRVRTVLDEEGKIVSANYGWTTDDIIFGINADGTCRIDLELIRK